MLSPKKIIKSGAEGAKHGAFSWICLRRHAISHTKFMPFRTVWVQAPLLFVLLHALVPLEKVCELLLSTQNVFRHTFFPACFVLLFLLSPLSFSSRSLHAQLSFFFEFRALQGALSPNEPSALSKCLRCSNLGYHSKGSDRE